MNFSIILVLVLAFLSCNPTLVSSLKRQIGGEGEVPVSSGPTKKSSHMGLIFAIVLLVALGGGGAIYWFFIRDDSSPSPSPTPSPILSQTDDSQGGSGPSPSASPGT